MLRSFSLRQSPRLIANLNYFEHGLRTCIDAQTFLKIA